MAFIKSLVAGFVILAMAMLAKPILVRALQIKAAGGGPSASRLPAAGRPGPAAPRRSMPGAARNPSPVDEPESLLDAVIDVRRIDGRINAATTRRLAQLLERHPDLAAKAMRRWLAQGSDSG